MDLSVLADDEYKKYNARQPRDASGKWSDGAGGISVGHALHVARHEGIADEHHAGIKEGIESGKLNTREKVLAHIDELHKAGASTGVASPKSRIEAVAKKHNLSELSAETLHDEIPLNPHLTSRVEEVGNVAAAAAKADGDSQVKLHHVLEALHYVGRPDGFAGHVAYVKGRAKDEANQRKEDGLGPKHDPDVERMAAISQHLGTAPAPAPQAKPKGVGMADVSRALGQRPQLPRPAALVHPRHRKSEEEESMDDETQVSFGDEIKSLGVEGNKARIGGYLVRFGSHSNSDLVGDWFTPDTYFGSRKGDGADAMIHHGLPLKSDPALASALAWTQDKLLPPLKTSMDEVGLFAETVCDLSDKHEAKIHEMVQAGKLKWSSGAAAHTVRRRDGAKTGEIMRWPITEGSLTPTPCQPTGTAVVSLKSLMLDEEGEDGDPFLKYNAQQSRGDDGRWDGGSGTSGGGHTGTGTHHGTASGHALINSTAAVHGLRGAAFTALHKAHDQGRIQTGRDLDAVVQGAKNRAKGGEVTGDHVRASAAAHGSDRLPNGQRIKDKKGSDAGHAYIDEHAKRSGLSAEATAALHDAHDEGHFETIRDVDATVQRAKNAANNGLDKGKISARHIAAAAEVTASFHHKGRKSLDEWGESQSAPGDEMAPGTKALSAPDEFEIGRYVESRLVLSGVR